MRRQRSSQSKQQPRRDYSNSQRVEPLEPARRAEHPVAPEATNPVETGDGDEPTGREEPARKKGSVLVRKSARRGELIQKVEPDRDPPPAESSHASEETRRSDQKKDDDDGRSIRDASSDASELMYVQLEKRKPSARRAKSSGTTRPMFFYAPNGREVRAILLRTDDMKSQPKKGTYAWIKRRAKDQERQAGALGRALASVPYEWNMEPTMSGALPLKSTSSRRQQEETSQMNRRFNDSIPYPPPMPPMGQKKGKSVSKGIDKSTSKAPGDIDEDYIRRLVQQQLKIHLGRKPPDGPPPIPPPIPPPVPPDGSNLLLTLDLRLNGTRTPLHPKNMTSSWHMPAA